MAQKTEHAAIIAKKVNALRALKKLTHQRLAAECDSSLTFVAALTSGRANPTLSSLEGVAKALGTTVVGLLTPDAVAKKKKAPAKKVAKKVAKPRVKKSEATYKAAKALADQIASEAKAAAAAAEREATDPAPEA